MTDRRGTGTAVAEDLRDRLVRLAHATAAPAGGATADRVLAANRQRRSRAVRWVAGAATVLVLGTAATLARPAEVDAAAQPAPATTRAADAPPAVYEEPPRGSLAGDEELLAQAAALPWTDPMDPVAGTTTGIEPDSRRVVYAADVPGGHRWVLVMARWRQQWMVHWFAGPRGATAAQLTGAHLPMPWSGRAPLALMDASGTRGPLLVLGSAPGAEYSPSLDRAPDGRLVRDFDPLPRVDGVLLGMVTTPVTWDAGQVYELRDGGRTQVQQVLYTGSPAWESWYAGTGGEMDDTVLSTCLTGLGYAVEDGPADGDVNWDSTVGQAESSAESAVREQAAADCYVQASTP